MKTMLACAALSEMTLTGCVVATPTAGTTPTADPLRPCQPRHVEVAWPVYEQILKESSEQEEWEEDVAGLFTALRLGKPFQGGDACEAGEKIYRGLARDLVLSERWSSLIEVVHSTLQCDPSTLAPPHDRRARVMKADLDGDNKLEELEVMAEGLRELLLQIDSLIEAACS